MAHHVAPAGGTYKDVFDAGRKNLILQAREFPYRSNSASLPPIFTTNFTERIDASTGKPVIRNDLQNPTAALKYKERKKYEGIVANQAGNEGERIVFEKLNALVSQHPADAVLVMYNFEMNWPKFQALSCDVPSTLPKLQFVKRNTMLQIDFLIIVRNIGLIFVEVKRKIFIICF